MRALLDNRQEGIRVFILSILIDGEWQECQSPMPRRAAREMARWYRTHTTDNVRTRITRQEGT